MSCAGCCGAASTRSNAGQPTVADEIPLVCFDADICRLLNLTPRTLRKLRTRGCFPIAELPRLDRLHRYAKRDVEAFLNRETVGRLAVVRRRAS
jgi:Helix-turn-helix domain